MWLHLHYSFIIFSWYFSVLSASKILWMRKIFANASSKEGAITNLLLSIIIVYKIFGKLSLDFSFYWKHSKIHWIRVIFINTKVETFPINLYLLLTLVLYSILLWIFVFRAVENFLMVRGRCVKVLAAMFGRRQKIL